jgi:anti-sigma regulatory factor (Ser/Thr protein kinase)
VVLAVGEAVANAIEHGRSAGMFSVECQFEAGSIIIEVADEGRGFAEWQQVETARSGIRRETLGPNDIPMRGFGIKIMHEMMDKVSYHDGGRRVRLVKSRTQLKSEEITGTLES